MVGFRCICPINLSQQTAHAWLLYLVKQYPAAPAAPAILVFIVQPQCVPCLSECIDNLAIMVFVLATLPAIFAGVTVCPF